MLRLCGAELRRGAGGALREPEQLREAIPAGWPRSWRDRAATARSGPTSSTMSPTATATTEPPARRSGQQTGGKVDAFICAVGTGGTLAGVGMASRSATPTSRSCLADPMGAALYNYYTHGELKAEGSSITEGIGQGRITANLEGAPVDDARTRSPTRRRCRSSSIWCSEEGLVLGGSTGHQHRGRDPRRQGARARATPS